MSFIFYIDGVKVNPSQSFKELSTSIKRENFSSILVSQDVKLRWNKKDLVATDEVNAYDTLKTLFESGICNEVDITIDYQSSTLVTHRYYTGVIKMKSLEFDLQQGYLLTPVWDNSYYAYIRNNQNIKVDFEATLSKDKIAITALPKYDIDMFDGTNGVRGSFIGMLTRGYRVFDIFTFLVAALTDNKVGFASDYLTASSTEIFLTKGQSIITSHTLFPLAPEPQIKLSFNELFNEINVQKNLAYYIDNTDPESPVLRIENFEALFGTDSGVVLENIKELKQTVSVSHLYSQVNVGSEVTIDGTDVQYTFNSGTSYFGWKIEQYFPVGQCGSSDELDLVNKFIIDNNSIMDALYGATENIDAIFLIECENIDSGALTCDAVAYEYFGTAPPYLYNLGLNNFNKITRHSSRFQTNLSNFLTLGSDGFRALLGDDALNNITYMTGAVSNPNFIPPGGLTIDPAEFPNETTSGGYDGNGNYDNVTFEYTIPADGDYSFLERLYVAPSGIGVDYFEIQASITLYDSGMAVKDGHTQSTPITVNQQVQTADVSFALTGVTGDIVRASYRLIYHPNGATGQQNPRFLQISYASYFECNGTPDGGITLASGSDDVKVLEFSFEYPISDSLYRTILSNPTLYITFTKDEVRYVGWLSQFKRNDQTGLTQFKLLTSNALITQ